MIGKVSANNLSISNDYVMSDDSLYLRINTTADGTGTDSTQIEIKLSDIATDFYIKNYPVMKM